MTTHAQAPRKSKVYTHRRLCRIELGGDRSPLNVAESLGSSTTKIKRQPAKKETRELARMGLKAAKRACV